MFIVETRKKINVLSINFLLLIKHLTIIKIFIYIFIIDKIKFKLIFFLQNMIFNKKNKTRFMLFLFF